ncbi:MAG: zinc ABC transporter substrate-binding protein [Nitrospinae bacterium]|nr:zinc ABC transporter substrate-binding protein [Nitrospinota bacterium]
MTAGYLAIALTAFLAAPVSAAPRVVTSIKPLHSLVSGVMKGVGEPYLLIRGVASPHTFSLKPSDARELERARVIFWVGDVLAPGLERPLEVLPKKANVVALGEMKGLELLKLREGGLWEGHDDAHGGEGKAEGDHHDEGKEAKAGDDDHDKEKHGKAEDDHHDEKEKSKAKDDDHHEKAEAKEEHHEEEKRGKTEDDDHDKEKAEGKEDHHDEKEKAEGHHGEEEDHHGGFDAHIWLDPMNARKWVDAIAHELEEVDPRNKKKYESNARNMKARIDGLHEELARSLAPVRGAPYIVFHDAYQYMEKRYGLTPIGSVTLSPEKKPGSARLLAIRRKIRDTKSICVFTEPQFQPRLVKVIMEGTGAGTGVLDPLGTGIPAGEDAYFTLMRNMAKSLKGCLSGK